MDVQRPVKGLIVHRVRVKQGELLSGAQVLASVDGEWRIGACQAHSAPTSCTPRCGRCWADGAAERLVQQAGLPPPRLRLAERAQQAGAGRRRGGGQPGDPQGPDVSATIMPLARLARSVRWRSSARPTTRTSGSSRWEVPGRGSCAAVPHVNTSQIGLVTITGESSVGSGVRRVEAFVGIEAFRYLAKERSLVLELSDALKVQPEQLPDRVNKLVRQLKKPKADRGRRGRTTPCIRRHRSPPRAMTCGVSATSPTARTACPATTCELALEIRNRVQDTASVVAVVGGAADKPSVVIVTTQAPVTAVSMPASWYA